MKITRFTVTIAIPAFNEESNINYLLKDLLCQKNKDYFIQKIMVVLDGCDDDTARVVKKFKSSRVDLLDYKIRKGLAFRQDQIFSLCKTDAIVLIQADIRIKDKYFVQKLVTPIIEKKADLTSARLEEMNSISLTAKALEWSMDLKKSIYQRVNSGQSVYTCYGPARAFSKKMYQSIKFKHSVGEDAFSYFYCLRNKMIYKHVKEAQVFYQLPQTIKDHVSQSLRFAKSQQLLEKEFGEKITKKEYSLPFSVVLIQLIKHSLTSPLNFLMYAFITLVVKLRALTQDESKDIWNISKSSKNLGGII